MIEESNNILVGVISSPLALFSVAIFVIAYGFVIAEEFIHLRKSKPVMIAAGLIWISIAYLAKTKALPGFATVAIKHNILEYAELFLFLLVAMTYVNALQERNLFNLIRYKLTSKGYSYRQLFWATGILSFFVSAFADNLTTALVMSAVVLAVGDDNKKFINLGCINIVIAANSGGAFSPFGDITTLMVWQKGVLPFQGFFQIFFPSLVSYLVPALLMHFAVPKATPPKSIIPEKTLPGAKRVILLFLLTIITAVFFHNYLDLPPAAGMMLGLGYLQLMGYYLKMQIRRAQLSKGEQIKNLAEFDVFKKVQRAEWDTLLFFYGIVLSVGGLATLGYLEWVSNFLYNDLGASLGEIHQHTPANVMVGLISAIIDNIPVMYAVLTMDPAMSEGQWLLVTLTAGIGGSLLSIGSAAGVALMSQSKGAYTFFSHIKWSWAVLLGFIAGIACHLWINQALFLN